MASFTDILKGGLAGAIDVRLEQERSEIQGERNEGVAEYANPNTVSQPVHHSALPNGQPLNFNTSSVAGVLTRYQGLIVGGLLVLIVVLLFLRRK